MDSSPTISGIRDLDALLTSLDKLPRDVPFVLDDVHAAGIARHHLRQLVAAGLLRHPMRNLYVRPEVEDTLDLRVRMLRLVVPADCVVTDRTAAWLWGAEMALAPGDHLEVPLVSVFCPPGRRLRNGLSASGERRLTARDVVDLGGLQVTSPLRTAVDLGRLVRGLGNALAAMDALAALERFSVDELVVEVGRFNGYRGVLQLRALAPFVDAGSQSWGESVLRFHWIDARLPRPRTQVPVPGPKGYDLFVDIGLPDDRFGAEYDGEQWHGEEEADDDEVRRGWLRERHGWVLSVARNSDISGPRQQMAERLRLLWKEFCDTRPRYLDLKPAASPAVIEQTFRNPRAS